MRVASRGERGFSLIEVLVTVAIMSITVLIFIGGMGTSFLVSHTHRKQAVAQASIRNFAEIVKATPFVADCATAAAKYLAAYNALPPTSTGSNTNTQSHVAPSVFSPSSKARLLAFFALANGTDPGLPTGMTVGWTSASKSPTIPSRVTVGFADQALSAEGATGTRTASSAAFADSVAQMVAVPATVTAGVARRGLIAASTPEAGATTLTLSSPASTSIGDAMFAQVALRNTAATVTPPAGWTLLSTATHGTSVKSLIFQKISKTAGAVSNAWTFSAATEAAGGIVSYSGASSGYEASIGTIVVWDGSTWADCATTPVEIIGAQRIPLTLESLDRQATQTVEVIKRCRERPYEGEPCEDSP